MDRMIFCDKCKVEEMIDDYYSDEWKCPKCNQPERSKREDTVRIYRCPQPWEGLSKEDIKEALENTIKGQVPIKDNSDAVL